MNLGIFQQSVFLQSLGWAIANSIWQGGLTWILIHIIGLCYSSASARFKNTTSTILLFVAFLWFIQTFLARLIYLQNNLYNASPRPFLFSIPLYSTRETLNVPGFISYLVVTLPYLSVAYLFLLLIFTIKLINAYRNTNSIKHNGLQKPSADWRLFVEKVTMHTGIHKKVKLWFSVYVDVPATIGFLKPVILIPVASLNQLTANQLEAIILHELSHIKRNDYLVNMLISLIETILFFNPFIALLSGIIKKERENCCDDFVIDYQYDRHSYASALLCLEKHRNQNFRLALTATSGKKQLLLRIKRIIDVKNSNNTLNYGQKLLALLVLTGIICSVAWLSPAKKAGQSPVHRKISSKIFNAIPPKRAVKSQGIYLTPNNPAKLPISSVPQITPIKENPVVPAPAIQPQNYVDEKQENPLSYSFDDNQITGIPVEQHGAQVLPEHTKDAPQTSVKNGSPASLNFSTNTNLLLNFAFDAGLPNVKAEIEKDNKALASIKWDKIGKDVREIFEQFKIPGVKIDLAEAQDPNLQYNLEKLTQKNIAKDLEQLLNNLKDVARVNVQRSSEAIFPDKAIKFLFQNNHDNLSFKLRKPVKTPPSPPPPPKQRNKPIIITQPPFIYDDDSGSEGSDSNDDVTWISSDEVPLNLSFITRHNDKQLITTGQKLIDFSDTRLSQQRILAKKLLIMLHKRLAVIQMED